MTSATMKKLRQDLTQPYDDILWQAQDAAKGSREKLYEALANAFVWHQSALQLSDDHEVAQEYLEGHFSNNKPSIPKREGQSEFARVIKLVFGMADPTHASTVSKYATALDYVYRQVPELPTDDAEANVQKVVQVIRAAGSIDKCVKLERANRAGLPQDADEKKVKEYLIKTSLAEYRSRQGLGSIAVPNIAGSDQLVLMMGRVGTAGSVDVVDVLDADQHDLERFVTEFGLRDTSSLDDALNVFGDSLALASVIKHEPVVTIEPQGKSLIISPSNNYEVGVVVRAEPKNGALPKVDERLHLVDDSRSLLAHNLIERPMRRLFAMIQNESSTAPVIWDLKNNVSDEVNTIRFEKPGLNAVRQVDRDLASLQGWQFEFEISLQLLEQIYGEWLKGWRSLKKSKPAEQVVTLKIQKDGLGLSAEAAGSRTGTYPVSTGLSAGEAYQLHLFGAELTDTLAHLRQVPGVDTLTFRGCDTGILEIEAESSFAKFMVDLPGVRRDILTHNTKHFAKLI